VSLPFSLFGLEGLLGIFWTKPSWPVCQTGLTVSPLLSEAKSFRISLIGFRTGLTSFGFQQLFRVVFHYVFQRLLVGFCS
jgi:hypothetical protein